jgi:hypothetical protein
MTPERLKEIREKYGSVELVLDQEATAHFNGSPCLTGTIDGKTTAICECLDEIERLRAGLEEIRDNKKWDEEGLWVRCSEIELREIARKALEGE